MLPQCNLVGPSESLVRTWFQSSGHCHARLVTLRMLCFHGSRSRHGQIFAQHSYPKNVQLRRHQIPIRSARHRGIGQGGWMGRGVDGGLQGLMCVASDHAQLAIRCGAARYPTFEGNVYSIPSFPGTCLLLARCLPDVTL
jgi:hypothetical protein